MEGFSISCTTCRARLRVRDARIVGQIVPCPKCGSMVLVTQQGSAASTGSEAVDAGFGLAGSTPTRVSYPPLDSFDNIDRLLEEPTRLPGPVRRQGHPRWRVSESQPGQPVPIAAAPGDVAPSHSADDSIGSQLPESPDDWMAARVALLRPYLLMGGGALLGVTLAMGLAGWYLARPAADAISVELATGGLPLGSGESDGGEPTEEPSSPRNDPDADDKLAVLPNDEVTEPPGEPVPVPAPAESTAPADSPSNPSTIAGSQSEPSSELPPSPPTAPTTGETSGSATARSTILPGANNDLAAFAQWLQNTDAVIVSTPSPAESSSPTEEPDQPGPQADDSPLIQPSRPAPPRVDVAARLEDPISALQLQDVPLIEVLRLVTQISTIPIRLEPDALGRRNLKADHPVRLTVRGETVRGLLDTALKGTGLSWFAYGDQVIVTTIADASGELVSVRHDVTDLTERDPAVAESLAADIKRLIEYGSWAGQGDENDEESAGRCEVEETSLMVVHRDVVQYQVRMFCEKLRVARGMSPRSRMLKDRVALGSRVAACAALDQSVSARIGQDRNIDQIAAELSRIVPVQILVDWPALYVAGWSPQDTEKFFYNQQPLREVLNDWLRPKGLTYRVIDSHTLEITTPAVLAATHDVEFYRLNVPAEQAFETSITLSHKLLARLGNAAFQPQGFGAISYDRPSQSLIVSLPQPEQSVAHELCKE